MKGAKEAVGDAPCKGAEGKKALYIMRGGVADFREILLEVTHPMSAQAMEK